MDALSEMLALARVRGSVFCRAELTTPWAVRTRPLPHAIFHVIVRGSGWVIVDGSDAPVPYRAGDLVLLPRGAGHVMASDPEVGAISMADLAAPPGDDGLPCVCHGGSGATTSILCGTFELDEDGRSLVVDPLPELICVRTGVGPTASWLDHTLQLLAAELAAGRPGSSLLLSRLGDVLLVQVLRAWIEQEAPEGNGWPAAMADTRLSRALDRLHGAPERGWTAAELARAAGMSRSAFYEHFQQVIGETPAGYLTQWRMVLARRALRDGASLAEVAPRVGYASEAAFSRAFKRYVGQSPSSWRSAVA